MTEWKDIASAKKDGSEMLLSAGGDRYYIGVGQWAECDPDFSNSVAGWFWPYAIRPTHWMPLPPPPEER
jgi:hypothetical protein